MVVTQFHARSREALAHLSKLLLPLSAEQAERTASDVYAVSKQIKADRTLQFVWTDSSVSLEKKKQLVTVLLSGKVSPESESIIQEAVVQDWSTPQDVALGLHTIANQALFWAAKQSNQLERVIDELLALSQLIKSNQDIEQNLTNTRVPLAGRTQWFSTLIDGKVSSISSSLAVNNFAEGGTSGALPGDVIGQLASEAAAVLDLNIADVVTAQPLSDSQREGFTQAIGTLFGKRVKVAARVDPTIIGGAIVTVGHESIDSSIAGKLEHAKNSIK